MNPAPRLMFVGGFRSFLAAACEAESAAHRDAQMLPRWSDYWPELPRRSVMHTAYRRRSKARRRRR